MAGLLWYRSYMDSLANTSGYYPDIHAGHADRVTELTLETPYLVRETPAGYNQLELMKLVGGSVAWNQLCGNGTSPVISASGVTMTVSNGEVTVSGTATANSVCYINGLNTTPITSGHKYFMSGCPSGGSSNTYFQRLSVDGSFVAADIGSGVIYSATTTALSHGVAVFVVSGTNVGTKKFYPQLIDLTLALGSTLADYVYSLEQSTVGSGIAWLKSYDYLKKDYYAYSAPALDHVKTTAHITKDAEDNVLGTYPFDSGLLLRGVLKLDNGALIYDGDTYEPDGTVTRYFGIRAYQAGDESLADAITDGTDTVYKLGAPTTESADPYTAMQDVEEGGAEEFVTGNNVPVGNVSVYRRA